MDTSSEELQQFVANETQKARIQQGSCGLPLYISHHSLESCDALRKILHGDVSSSFSEFVYFAIGGNVEGQWLIWNSCA